MVGHIAVPALDESGAPASLSVPIVQGLLRQGLGFKGLVISDDLEMGALSSLGAGEIAVRALEAGCDLLLFCHTQSKVSEALRAVENAHREGRLAERNLAASLQRIATFKARFGA